jgi:hypothetical protein
VADAGGGTEGYGVGVCESRIQRERESERKREKREESTGEEWTVITV